MRQKIKTAANETIIIFFLNNFLFIVRCFGEIKIKILYYFFGKMQ
jgi:hypothetical protein